MFTGRSALSLDAKGRLSVPTRYRDDLVRQAAGRLTITTHPFGSLLIFPRPAWETFRDTKVLVPQQNSDTRRFYLGNAMDVEMDGAGRVLVSPELRQMAGLEKDVYLVGNGERFELWDRVRLDEREAKVMSSVVDL